MKLIAIPIPEEIIEYYNDIDKLKKIIIEDFVASEYEKGNISIRQGANILGLTYEKFMVDFLGKRKISFISGTSNELESEFRQEKKWLDEVLASR
ncbi:MAG TPA: UPF0175 family protein [Thermodesulfovibrionia bacterium]|nr:UPF0175 family protein [Thermodesulfovibrionia bacterium]